MIGTKLAHYDITSHLGTGGMGEVYQATDSKLGRSVAIKLLPAAFASDPDRLSRFRREAQLLASLNHPNIAHIYGLEESGDTRCIVMELIEGETLQARIKKGPIAVDEALVIAKQIAEALEAAHEKGVIHRDLKPGNVMLTGDGRVKVLDFGLAKAYDANPGSATSSNSPTMASMAATNAGVILGTAAYMAPEQARGKTVDKRADIWAFGAVVFEMLTGQRAFPGEDLTDTLANVLKMEPDWGQLPTNVPPRAMQVLRACLQKNARQRIEGAQDIRLALEGAFETEAPQTTAAATSPDLRWTRKSAFRLAVAAAVVTALAAGGGVWMLSRATPQAPAPIARLAMTLPESQRFGDPQNPLLAISPQGTLVAYTAESGGQRQLYVRAIDSVESKALARTGAATNPFFSPDGQWIGFFAQGKLMKVSVSAGTTQTLCDAPSPRGGSWAGGEIYFAASTDSGISKVSADGGTPTVVTTLDRSRGEVSHRWPQVLPGGGALLFTVWTGPGADEQRVDVQRLGNGERTVVVQAGASGRYLASGHVVYARNDELFALAFDLGTLKASGQAVRLGDGAYRGGEGSQYAVSDNGVMVSLSGSLGRYERRLVWVGRDGRVDPLAAPPRYYSGNAVISPDGQRAAVDIEAGTIGVWLYDFMRATLTPLTTGKGSSQAPRWTPDGTHIVYRGTRAGTRNIWWKTVDNTVEEERLTTGETTQTPGSWSGDGQWLAYALADPATGPDIWALHSGGDRKAHAVVRTPFAEWFPRLSPDGHWLAYTSNESGRTEVLVQSFPEPGGRTQISTSGGIEPVWSRDGRELFYLNGDAMMAVEVRTSPALTVGAPRKLFEGRYVLSPNSVASYDVSADGQRFLRVQPMHPDPAMDQIQVALNWFEELKRLVPTN